MGLRDRLIELRDAIRAATAASGAQDVRVFGSVARGEEARDSDVDLLVRLDPGRTLLALARLEVRLEKLLGRHVDVVTEDGLRKPPRQPHCAKPLVSKSSRVPSRARAGGCLPRAQRPTPNPSRLPLPST